MHPGFLETKKLVHEGLALPGQRPRSRK
jgi:hypothetical protein